jgi:hypothetical protein
MLIQGKSIAELASELVVAIPKRFFKHRRVPDYKGDCKLHPSDISFQRELVYLEARLSTSRRHVVFPAVVFGQTMSRMFSQTMCFFSSYAFGWWFRRFKWC